MPPEKDEDTEMKIQREIAKQQQIREERERRERLEKSIRDEHDKKQRDE